MKSKMSIKNIIIMAAVGIISLFFINMSFAVSTGKIKVETANLRETADENAKILEQLSNQDEVEIVEKEGDWYKVKAKGMTGYLRQDLITVKEEENITPKDSEAEKTEENQKQEENKPEETNKEEPKKELALGKQKIAEDTKLKIVPVINATDIIEVKKEQEVNAIEIVNGWVCVEVQTTKGWIRKEKLQKEEPKTESVASEEEKQPVEEQPKTVIKTLYVNSASINLRKEASTSSEILANLPVNTSVDVLAENSNGWSQVKINGKEGYILTSLLSSRKQETSRAGTMPRTSSKTTQTAVEEQEKQVPVSGNGASVVAYAKQFIGTKYTYGGSSPSTGFDCSGFTSYVYRQFGVSLPRTSGGQSGAGVAVSRENLVAGDLVIYSGHVAIYVGGGQVIHAPRPGKTVCIVPLSQAGSNYLGARRVI